VGTAGVPVAVLAAVVPDALVLHALVLAVLVGRAVVVGCESDAW